MTQKDLVERWWIGPGYEVRVDELDAKNGGSWKFIQTNDEGRQYTFRGVFHLVRKPSTSQAGLIIQTHEYEIPSEPGSVGLQRIELTRVESGATRMISTGTFLSVADRDAVIESGMEGGMQHTYSKLDEILQSSTS